MFSTETIGITPSKDLSDGYLTFEVCVPAGSYVKEIHMRGPSIYKSFKIDQMEIQRYETYEPLLYSYTKERIRRTEIMSGIKFVDLDLLLLAGYIIDEVKVTIEAKDPNISRYYSLIIPKSYEFARSRSVYKDISEEVFRRLSYIRQNIGELVLLANKFDAKSILYQIPKDLIKYLFSFCGHFTIKMNFDEPLEKASEYMIFAKIITFKNH